MTESMEDQTVQSEYQPQNLPTETDKLHTKGERQFRDKASLGGRLKPKPTAAEIKQDEVVAHEPKPIPQQPQPQPPQVP